MANGIQEVQFNTIGLRGRDMIELGTEGSLACGVRRVQGFKGSDGRNVTAAMHVRV